MPQSSRGSILFQSKAWHEKAISEFCESIEGVTLLALCNTVSGLGYSSLERYIVRNSEGFYYANGFSLTTANWLNWPGAITSIGTATARNFADTVYGREALLARVSSSAAGSFAANFNGTSSGSRSIQTGSGTGYGFTRVSRFAISDASSVTGATLSNGVSGTTVTPTNVEPSSLLNHISVIKNSTDTNFKIAYGGSSAQAPIDLGVNFPATTSGVDVYEFSIFSFAELNNKIGWQLKRLNTGNIARGVLTAATPGVELPLSSTPLVPMRIWYCNNATALSVSLDTGNQYLGRP